MTVPLCSRPDDTRPSLCKSLLCISLRIQRGFCAGVWLYIVNADFIEIKSAELMQSGWRAADPLKMEQNLFLCQKCWHWNDQIEYLGNTFKRRNSPVAEVGLFASSPSLKHWQMLLLLIFFIIEENVINILNYLLVWWAWNWEKNIYLNWSIKSNFISNYMWPYMVFPNYSSASSLSAQPSGFHAISGERGYNVSGQISGFG